MVDDRLRPQLEEPSVLRVRDGLFLFHAHNNRLHYRYPHKGHLLVGLLHGRSNFRGARPHGGRIDP